MNTRRAIVAVLVAVASLLATALVAPAADAALGVRSTGSFSAEAPPQPRSVAVDETTGDVLATENQGEGVVAIYAGGEAGPAKVGQFGAGELVDPRGIAIDQETGDVYVGDASLGRILRYKRSAGSPPTYTVDSSYVGPSLGSGPGEVGSFAGQLAIDPTNGDLLLSDPSNNRIDRFGPAGTFLSSFDGADSARGAFHHILDLAVAGDGQIYVVDLIAEEIAGPSDSVVERFSQAGSYLSTPAVPEARSVTFDPVADVGIAVGEDFYNFFTPPPHARFFVLDEGSVLNEVSVPSPTGESRIDDLAADGTHGRVFAATNLTEGQYGVTGGQAFDSFLLPNAATGQVTSITAETAHASGTINPLGEEAGYYFEYSSDGGQSWQRTAEVDAGAGETDVQVATDLSGLIPNKRYEVRLVGVNANGSNPSRAVAFDTAAGPPGVVTGEASGRGETEATLSGTVNPFGFETTYYFEYGPTGAYGSRVPEGRNAVLGHGVDPVAVSATISGLAPGTDYHYRLVAVSSIGTSAGSDGTFTTVAAAAPHRAYEMVSPPEKGNASVKGFPTGEFGFQARADGDSIVYSTQAPLPGSRSAPVSPKYLATRSASGWSTFPMDPRSSAPTSAHASHFVESLAVSEDQSHALVMSMESLLPGHGADQSTLYREDLTTGALEFIGSAPGLDYMMASGGQASYLGGSSDFSTIAFSSKVHLLPETEGLSNVYVWTEAAGLRAASLPPNGEHGELSGGGSELNPAGRHQVSVDGNRVFVAMGESEAIPRPGKGLYVYERGNLTPISVSHIEGAPVAPVEALFVSASARGNRVLFQVVGKTPLTVGAPPIPGNIYLADLETGGLTLVAVGAYPLNVVGTSEDLSHVYFKSTYDITPQSKTVPGMRGLYVGANGVDRFIAPYETAKPGLEAEFSHEFATSPNGRYFAFNSTLNLTGYDNLNPNSPCSSSGCSEIFRYDAADGSIICASCRKDGGRPLGRASMDIEGQAPFFNRHEPEPVLNDGRVFLDTPDPLVNGDSNGNRDVYEISAAGEATLISGGKANTVSALADVTPDGKNVFFVTNDRLVAADTDVLNDLYDARVGGGIASQDETPGSGVSCGVEDCRNSPAGNPPGAVTVGSEGSSAPPKHITKKKKRSHQCRKHRPKQKSKGVKGCRSKHNHGKAKGGAR